MRLIVQSLLVAAAVIGSYAAAITRVPESVPRLGATTHQNNFVRAESVLHAERRPNNLLLGSSLTERLQPEFLGPEFASLALGGGGPATGLEIIRRGGLKPRTVWIEANLLAKDPDPELLDYLFDSPWAAARRRLPWLRQANQPVNLLFSLLQSRRQRAVIKSYPVTLRAALEHFRAAKQAVPDTARLRLRLEAVAQTLRSLQADGVAVRLVEFPTHPELAATPNETALRAELHRVLPEEEFTWVRPTAGFAYVTTDGLHLDTASARQFAGVLRQAAGLKVP